MNVGCEHSKERVRKVYQPLVAVRAIMISFAVGLCLEIRGVRAGGTTCELVTPLAASDASAFDRFGVGLSVRGGVAAVGARLDDCSAGSDCGSVYVFRQVGTSWVQEQKLVADDASGGDQFGVSVSVSQDVILVGAYHAGSHPQEGAAYVYRFNGSSWDQEQKLTSPDPSSMIFGISVALEGNVAAIGESSFESVYVFRYDGNTWGFEQELKASDAGAYAQYGLPVAIDGNMIAVAAYLHGCPGPVCGAVYVYRFSIGNWIETQKLVNPTGSEFFGRFISLNGDHLLINADPHSWIYRLDGGSWTEEQELEYPVPAASTAAIVAVHGDLAAIGNTNAYCEGTPGTCGSVAIYQRTGHSWDWVQNLNAANPIPGDFFGGSIAIDGDIVFVSADGVDCAAGNNCGATYVFNCARQVPTVFGVAVVALGILIGIVGAVAIRTR